MLLFITSTFVDSEILDFQRTKSDHNSEIKDSHRTKSEQCIYFTNVTGNKAIIHFDWTGVVDHPFLRWDIEIKAPNKSIYTFNCSSKPLEFYLTDLEEWTTYTVAAGAQRLFYINDVLYDYTNHVSCKANFTTIPRDLRIDHIYTGPALTNVYGMAQIFEPQKYKFRFEYGEIDSFEFIYTRAFKDMRGVGVVSDSFARYERLRRIRFVIKSKPDYLGQETYISPTYIIRI